MIIPHERGSKTVKIKFNKTDDLPSVKMDDVKKNVLKLIEIKKPENKAEETPKKLFDDQVN
jgi:hypothetical protein